VQAVLGRVGDTDDLADVVTVPLSPCGRGEFAGTLRLPFAGSLGYTVRVLPRHRLLATPAELGKVVLA
jgi:starch phosphorylase